MFQNTIYVCKLGLMKYGRAWKLQKYLAEEVSCNAKIEKEPKHKLLIVEHHPVYTVGIRDSNYSEEEAEKLRLLGADFVRTSRGGLITFHGPGQLTAYPILHLSSFQKGIKWYVCALEKTVIQCCEHFGIKAHTTKDTGIWIQDRKICAIGIHGRHVTTHGLALNCNIDLGWFDHIVPCGLEDKSATSFSKELERDISVSDVLPHFLRSFAETFNVPIVENEQLTIPESLLQS